MESFNPLSDVMRANVASMVRVMGRTKEEREAEGAAVVQIKAGAFSALNEQREQLHKNQLRERQDLVDAGIMVKGDNDYKALVKEQQAALRTFDRIAANLG